MPRYSTNYFRVEKSKIACEGRGKTIREKYQFGKKAFVYVSALQISIRTEHIF